MVLRIRLQSHQVHLTMLQYYTCMQYTVRHKIIHTQKWILCHMGTQLPQKGGTSAPSPIFGPCLLPTGWMDEDAAWYGSGPQPRPHCVRQGASSPLRERGTTAPSFRPMSIVATVAHLSYCRALVLNFIGLQVILNYMLKNILINTLHT